MTSSPERSTWSWTYRVSSEPRQQLILRAFHRLAHSGIMALGTSDGGEFFVVVDSTSAAADAQARRVVLTLDLVAKRIEKGGASDEFYESAAPDRAYLSGRAVPRALVRLMQVDGNHRHR